MLNLTNIIWIKVIIISLTMHKKGITIFRPSKMILKAKRQCEGLRNQAVCINS